MDASHQLLDELTGAPEHGRLERGLVAVAVHADPGLDTALVIAQLDRVAESHGHGDPARLAARLFGTDGFQPNIHNYYDPANSLLDRVLKRRLGIPLSLSALALAVAERWNAPLVGVGMPGHFLLGEPGDVGQPPRYFDPFDQGRALTPSQVAELHVRLLGRPLPPNSLAPVDHRVMLVRTLANLRIAYSRHHDLEGLAWVLPLLAECCASKIEAQQELAVVLTRLGRWGAAASVCAALAEGIEDDERSSRWRAEGHRLSALLN